MLQKHSKAAREELGYIGVFATKGRWQEQKRPGLTEITALICTSAIRARILSFHSLQDSPTLTLGGDYTLHSQMTVTFHVLSLTTDGAEVFQVALKYYPKEERGISGYDKGEGKVHVAHTHFTKFVSGIRKVTSSQSQGADITMKDISIFLDMRRCKNWAHKIFF